MAVAETAQQGLMRKRARALAVLRLTDRDGMDVQDVADDIGVDLLARLPLGRRAGLRQFGIRLDYVLDDLTDDEAAARLRRAARSHDADGPFPFPVAVFLFTMRRDQGWYGWAAEPVVSADGRPELPARPDPDCRPLDRAGLDDLFVRVDRWYDAFYAGLAAIPAKKRAKRS